MNKEETDESFDGEVKSAWPLLIGGIIIGAIIASVIILSMQGKFNEEPENKTINTESINKIINGFESGNKEDVKSFLMDADSQIQELNKENEKLKMEARTKLVFNPTTRQSYTREYLIKEIAKANDIVWITNSTRNITVLQECRKKIREGKKASVLTSKNVIQRNVKIAKDSGFYTYSCNAEFSDTISILIINSKEVIDIANDDVIWITKEPSTIKNIIDWYNKLMETGVNPI